jgi:hypothetical protein
VKALCYEGDSVQRSNGASLWIDGTRLDQRPSAPVTAPRVRFLPTVVALQPPHVL